MQGEQGNFDSESDKDKYEGLLTDEPEDFANLAEEVMGNVNQKAGGDDGVS